jgi:uncharacterized membrane protein YhhN
MMLAIPASALVALVVAFLLRAEFAGSKKGIYVWKPIASTLMTAVLLLSFAGPGGYRTGYTLALLAGMALCFGGDMALMFMDESKKAFRIGLGLFLLGHVAYIVALTAFNGFQAADWMSGLVLAAAAAFVFVYLLPSLGDMKIPVLVYILIVSLMVNRALSAFAGTYFGSTQALLLAAGALLFYVSDLILALHRFRFKWRYGRINLAFYYAGQVLIALSASFFR